MKLSALCLAAAALATRCHSSPLGSSSTLDIRSFGSSRDATTTETCDTGDAAHPHGTCFFYDDCVSLGGVATAQCAPGLGVCCYMTRTCGQTITTNLTSFVNPSYPSADTTSNRCVTEVELIDSNVCQLRLDFIKMEIAGPSTASGVCDKDFFMETGNIIESRIPKICGNNTGQHMYVDVDPKGGNLHLTMDLALLAASRSWEIKVTQIKCDSVERAPSGCLQYFNTTSGDVRSFNYIDYTPQDLSAGPVEGVHLASQNYRVCIAPQPGFCSIDWQRASTTSFGMTGPVSETAANIIGSADAGWPSSADALACPDFLLIPGGSHPEISATELAGNRDRFCGSYFPTVSSTLQPFMLHVVTDASETTTVGTATAPDDNNVGFNLNYRMKAC